MTGEDLQFWMRGHGLNQKKLASWLGVTQGQVSRWCTGQTKIPGPVLRCIWLVLHCDIVIKVDGSLDFRNRCEAREALVERSGT